MTNKTLLAGLLSGVALFFAGWVIYGMIAMGYLSANSNQCAANPKAK